MKRFAAAAAAFAAALGAAQPAAARTATVEAVQYPAWLERGGLRVPLTPGTILVPRDRLRSGAGARIELRMGEGSAVKLGENAQMVIERAEDRNVFRAGLAVLAGAFRFTSRALRAHSGRDVAIRVKNVTVGIRGTDVWGKSTDDRDLVCLLEGAVTVGAEGHPQVRLDRPLAFYQKPRVGDPSVARADAKQVQEWAKETEIDAGSGAAARRGGRWRVVAAVFPDRDKALELVKSLRTGGYPAEIVPTQAYFAVHVPGLAGEAAARAAMANLREFPGVGLPHVREGP